MSTPVHVDLLSFTYQRQIRQSGGESRPALEELCRHITPEHAENWRRIGTQLGVFYTDLNTIEQIYPGLHEICCNEMFEKWLQNEPQATWNDVFSAVGIESWYDNPDNFHKSHDVTDASSRSNTSTGFILGAVPRHCILHVLTIIKEAMYKGNSSLLDDFVRDISELVKSETSPAKSPPSNSQYGGFKKLDPPPVIPVRAVEQFKNKAISTVEFAKLLESRLSSSASSAFIELNLDILQRVCWKYYLTEKTATLPQCSWLNHSVCYQLFLLFNKILGENYGIVITGDKLNDLLEKIASSLKRECVAYNSVHMTFDFATYLLQIIVCVNNFKVLDSSITSVIRDIYEEEVNGVLKRGYLVKKGGKRKNWKRRWFVLKSKEMSYYESYENMTLKGKISLNYHSDVLGTPDEKNKMFRFIVICGDSKRAYEIKAPDQQSKNEWLDAIKKVLDENRETARGGKLRSKSSPVTPQSTRCVISQSLSADVPSHSSIDLDDTNLGRSIDYESDSDSDCYVGPLEVNDAMRMSYAEGTKQNAHLKESEDINEYDYPYMENLTHQFSQVKPERSLTSYKNVPSITVMHNRVQVTKSNSSDNITNPDKVDEKGHKLLAAREQMVRALSQVEILEPLNEGEGYVKMEPEKMNAMVKSHSYDNTRILQSMFDKSKTPEAPGVNSEVRYDYETINRHSAIDDSVYTPLSPNEDEIPESTTGHSAEVDDTNKNFYLPLLAPSHDDIMKAQAKHNSKLVKSKQLTNVRRKPTT